MPPRKKRISVVFDTNVIVSYYLLGHVGSVNTHLFRLWRNRRELQLITSIEIVREYFDVLDRLGIDERRIARFHTRLNSRDTVTLVSPGSQPTESSDPDDNIFLAAAIAGKARFLITNDRHLLDIPAQEQRKFRFQILTPKMFLDQTGL